MMQINYSFLLQLSTEGRNMDDVTALSGLFRSFSDAPGGFKEDWYKKLCGQLVLHIPKPTIFCTRRYFNENEYKGGRRYFTQSV